MSQIIDSDNQLAILFCSFDKNFQRWPITHYFFTKFWSSCPYQIYLGANGTEQLEHCPKQWRYINSGPDDSWQKSMTEYLNTIPAEYILLFVDDTALIEPVDNAKVDEVIAFMQKNNAVMCRLNPRPGPDKLCDNYIGRINVAAGVPYIASWTNVIWRKDTLIELLKLNYNAWEFETKAGKSPLALGHANDFYACETAVINYIHFVEKNKYDPIIKEMLKNENINIDFNGVQFLNKKELKKLRYGVWSRKIQSLIPNRYRNKVRKCLGLEEL